MVQRNKRNHPNVSNFALKRVPQLLHLRLEALVALARGLVLALLGLSGPTTPRTPYWYHSWYAYHEW